MNGIALRKHKNTVKKLETGYIEARRQYKGLRKSDKTEPDYYYALDECDEHGLSLDWYESDVEEFDQLWSQGWSIEKLSEYFGRTLDEIGILVIDRAIKGKIKAQHLVS